MSTKLDQLTKSLENISTKKFKVLFFAPETEGTPSAAISEIYTHALTLIEMGYDAKILTEKKDYVVPSYLEAKLMDIPHVSTDGASFKIGVEDYLIIPEFFTNLMEKTKNLPCTRIVFAQSIDNVIGGLLPGMTYGEMKIRTIITTNNKVKEFIDTLHGVGKYNIKTYTVGIPDYFQPTPFKKATISFLGRNRSDMAKINKMFYLLYPELKWVVFDDLKGNTREEFARKLKESLVTVWVDRVSSFGTHPLEAMKCETPIIGLLPDMIQEHITEDSGFWTDNILEIPRLVGLVFKAAMESKIPAEMKDEWKKRVIGHTEEASTASIQTLYCELFEDKISDLKKAIEELEVGRKKLTGETEKK
jgi:hypothetical protein